MKFVVIACLAAIASAADENKKEPYSHTFTFEGAKANVTSTTAVNPQTHTVLSTMRRKYRDYFAYSFKAKNVTNEEAGLIIAECDTSSDCGDSGETQHCCVNTVLRHPATNTQDIQYRCMTKNVVNANVDLELGDFSVQMKCMGSGAATLFGSVIGAAAVMASLF